MMEKPPIELTAARVEDLPLHHADAKNSQVPRHESDDRRFILRESAAVKFIGYNATKDGAAASTGTSQLNTLCMTEGMGPRIGVAIGGESSPGGLYSPGAAVRVFHVFPQNSGIRKTVGDSVRALQQRGLSVRAVMNGGESNSLDSRNAAKEVRSLFAELNAGLVDEACERREGTDQPLGVVIRDDHSVQFVTELFQQL